MGFAHDIPIPDNNIDTYLEIIVDFVALEDCEDFHRFKKRNVIINDGHTINWVIEL